MTRRSKGNTVLVIAAIVLIASVMRSPITGVGPISEVITGSTGLSAAAVGVLTSIPLLTFAICSIPAAKLSHSIGVDRTVLIGALCIFVGTVARSVLGTFGLYVGMVLIGAGIAACNVLIPVVVKDRFPKAIGPLTSTYSTSMSISSGIAGGIALPMAIQWGWEISLGVWAVVGALAVAFWIPCIRKEDGPAARNAQGEEAGKPATNGGPAGVGEPASNGGPAVSGSSDASPAKHAHRKSGETRKMAKHPMAWCMGVYFGLQSVQFYTFAAWLIAILQTKGFTADEASILNAVYILIGIVGSIVAPAVTAKFRTQSSIALALAGVYTASLLCVAFGTGVLWVSTFVVACGLCQGACFAFIMTLFALKARTPEDAASLSGFAQTVGYVIAAVGPALAGVLFKISGEWLLLFGFLIFGTVMLMLLGWYIGRDRIVG